MALRQQPPSHRQLGSNGGGNGTPLAPSPTASGDGGMGGVSTCIRLLPDKADVRRETQQAPKGIPGHSSSCQPGGKGWREAIPLSLKSSF